MRQPQGEDRRPVASGRRNLRNDGLAELDRLAQLLDSQWRIPGTRIKFGVDAIIGLVPGLGDLATGVVSAHLLLRAARFGIPPGLLGRMIGNVAVDTVVGSIPLLGSVFDLFFKANNRNLSLLRRHLQDEPRRTLPGRE
jgi:hypothetical protein